MKEKINGRLFYSLFLAFFLTVVPCVDAEDNAPVKKETDSDHSITINTGDTIQIEMKNTALHDALKAVTQKSKIHFEVPESLLKDKITFRFTGKDWPEAIKRMLKKYNIAYGWEKSELKKVFIFEHGTGKVLQLIAEPVDDLPPSDPAESNQQASDVLEDEPIIPPIPSIPSFPTEEEKMIEIKYEAHESERREKKPDMEKPEDLLKGLPPELPADPQGQESENPSDSFASDEPAPENVSENPSDSLAPDEPAQENVK